MNADQKKRRPLFACGRAGAATIGDLPEGECENIELEPGWNADQLIINSIYVFEPGVGL
jgi:hypothetical protein